MNATAFRPTGAVYGTLMNFRSEHEALAAQMNEPPYKAPPKAPVLYVEPANTWVAPGQAIVVPAGRNGIELGATLAMVMAAPGQIAGWVLVGDATLPHTGFFRPAVKQRCFDSSIAFGSKVAALSDPAATQIELRVNGQLRQTVRFDALVRSPARLFDDVAEFMTLDAGELLMLGCEAQRPTVRPGDTVELRAPGLGELRIDIVQEAA